MVHTYKYTCKITYKEQHKQMNVENTKENISYAVRDTLRANARLLCHKTRYRTIDLLYKEAFRADAQQTQHAVQTLWHLSKKFEYKQAKRCYRMQEESFQQIIMLTIPYAIAYS